MKKYINLFTDSNIKSALIFSSNESRKIYAEQQDTALSRLSWLFNHAANINYTLCWQQM